MKVLLDTQALLWFVTGSDRLSVAARKLIEDEGSELYVSIGSVWEMAIKISIGKLVVTQPLDTFVRDHVGGNGISVLDISVADATRVAGLPFHHRDPFDRLLVAQALENEMVLVSIDGALDAYGVDRRW